MDRVGLQCTESYPRWQHSTKASRTKAIVVAKGARHGRKVTGATSGPSSGAATPTLSLEGLGPRVSGKRERSSEKDSQSRKAAL